jgi:molybdopterin converting factor small subunit
VNTPIGSAEVAGRYAESALLDLDIEAVDQFIAGVLRRAHRAALAVGEPAEARAILDVAQLFADELATAVSDFDRMAFLAAVIDDGS